MRALRSVPLVLVLCLAGVLTIRLLRGSAQQDAPPQAAPVPMALNGVAVQLTLGMTDKEPTDWSGELRVQPGRVIRLEARLGQDDSIEGNAWRLRSRRPRPRRATAPVRLVAMLDAPQDASVSVSTGRGDFAFRLADLSYAAQSQFLDGAAAAQRMPLHTQITGSPTEDDFPACAVGSDGTIWCAHLAYHRGNPVNKEEVARGEFGSLVTKGNGDELRLMRFSDREWSPPVSLAGPGADLWRPAVATDRAGNVWVIWSQNRRGNWDLYARRFDPASGRLSRVTRLTNGPGADINVVAATDPEGSVWVAWQGWRDDNFDIWLARLTSDGVARRHRVSDSDANDWSPALGVAASGRLWVAWDTYDKGDYDVYLRSFADGELGEPIPIATSPRYEARPSLAVDGRDRVWIAFEDSAPNWGKDYGDRWDGRSGMPFYIERNIIVRCLAGGRLQQTAADFRSGLVDTHYDDRRKQTERHHRISLPRLSLDDQGRLWLLFRRHPLASAAGERWVGHAAYYQGDRWSEQMPLPKSANLLDNRPSSVALAGTGLLVVYATDQRTSSAASAVENDLYAAVLSAEGNAKEPILVATEPAGEGPPAEPVHPGEQQAVQRARSHRVTVAGKTLRLLRGEFHRHTELSSHRDWDGPMEEVWRYGLDVASMDWIGVGDHDYMRGKEYGWWLTQKQTEIYHHPPVFVPVHSYERSVSYPSGHRNVIFARRGIRALPRLGPGRDQLYGTPEEGSPDIKNLYAYLKAFDGICASHTSGSNMGTDWRDNDPEVEPVVEIYQGHRLSYEEPGAPKAAKNAEESIQGYREDGFVWNALAKGYRLGFQASSDHVSTHISYANVFAEENTREGIVDGLRKRHCYGANDNIILEVRCGGKLMGDELTTRARPVLEVTILGTAPVARVDIVRMEGNSTPVYVYNAEPRKQEVRFRWEDDEAQPGSVYLYYVRLLQQDSKMAWGSPMWLHYQG
ncbi:MAG: hypothetical protein ACE5R4_04885 [Armatimonadota bacterium]